MRARGAAMGRHWDARGGTAPVGVGRGREVRGMVQAVSGRVGARGLRERVGRAVARGSPDIGSDRTECRSVVRWCGMGAVVGWCGCGQERVGRLVCCDQSGCPGKEDAVDAEKIDAGKSLDAERCSMCIYGTAYDLDVSTSSAYVWPCGSHKSHAVAPLRPQGDMECGWCSAAPHAQGRPHGDVVRCA